MARSSIITLIYISVQLLIALFVSIIGAVHVRRCINALKELKDQVELQIDPRKDDVSPANNAIQSDIDNPNKQKQKGFFELWARTVWKMRGVYASFAVHSFDVLTDIIVIIQWLQAPDIDGDHIDPQINSHKIYESHRRIISQIKSKNVKSKATAIESTLSFKYIRNFEAVFESIPQSILQLIYVIRTGTTGTDLGIFVISIIQSIVSMVNSILNSDNTEMQEAKWKKYKQRLPPSPQFAKHALSRFSEVTYRIGLLSLFWSVCGGLQFTIMLAVEALLIVSCRVFQRKYDNIQFNPDALFLTMSMIVTIPSEEVYWGSQRAWPRILLEQDCECLCVAGCLAGNLLCCTGLSGFIQSFLQLITNGNAKIYSIPTARIGVSLMEFIILIIWAFLGDNGDRKQFLFSFDHGLAIGIASCVFFIVYTQYSFLFPDFALPGKAKLQTKWGYAFANELTELKRVRIPLNVMPYHAPVTLLEKRKTFLTVVQDSKVRNRLIKDENIKAKIVKDPQFEQYIGKWYNGESEPTHYSNYDRIVVELNKLCLTTTNYLESYTIRNVAQFWDQPLIINVHPATAAVFALANEHFEIVTWLEKQGAVSHKGMTISDAKMVLGMDTD